MCGYRTFDFTCLIVFCKYYFFVNKHWQSGNTEVLQLTSQPLTAASVFIRNKKRQKKSVVVVVLELVPLGPAPPCGSEAPLPVQSDAFCLSLSSYSLSFFLLFLLFFTSSSIRSSCHPSLPLKQTCLPAACHFQTCMSSYVFNMFLFVYNCVHMNM